MKDALYYLNRALAYEKLGKEEQAVNDFKTTARFGNKIAQEKLESKGIE